MAPANIFLALLDSASIAHDVAKLEALKANAKTEDAQRPRPAGDMATQYPLRRADGTRARGARAATTTPEPTEAVGAGWLLERCRAWTRPVGAA